tara:strand:+ start:384 stop:533 length:150 start_codon:yes stop_codon:yes gene_type:complete
VGQGLPQRALDLQFPSLERWLAIVASTGIVLAIGFRVFNRLEPRMAEEV